MGEKQVRYLYAMQPPKNFNVCFQLDVVTVDGRVKTDPRQPNKTFREKAKHFFTKYFLEG